MKQKTGKILHVKLSWSKPPKAVLDEATNRRSKRPEIKSLTISLDADFESVLVKAVNDFFNWKMFNPTRQA